MKILHIFQQESFFIDITTPYTAILSPPAENGESCCDQCVFDEKAEGEKLEKVKNTARILQVSMLSLSTLW